MNVALFFKHVHKTKNISFYTDIDVIALLSHLHQYFNRLMQILVFSMCSHLIAADLNFELIHQAHL